MDLLLLYQAGSFPTRRDGSQPSQAPSQAPVNIQHALESQIHHRLYSVAKDIIICHC